MWTVQAAWAVGALVSGRHYSSPDELGEAKENGKSLCTDANQEIQCLLHLTGDRKVYLRRKIEPLKLTNSEYGMLLLTFFLRHGF